MNINQNPGNDQLTVVLVGLGLAICLTVALWAMLVPR